MTELKPLSEYNITPNSALLVQIPDCPRIKLPRIVAMYYPNINSRYSRIIYDADMLYVNTSDDSIITTIPHKVKYRKTPWMSTNRTLIIVRDENRIPVPNAEYNPGEATNDSNNPFQLAKNTTTLWLC